MVVRRDLSLATVTALALASGTALVACFDLLHSTADVLTACEIDASRPGCTATVVETNFCAWSHDEASRHALHACAWLGACESPMGGNAFGACYFRALLAYDCTANPNHKAKGAAHRLWDCLQQVKTCGDVDTCIFGEAAPSVCGKGGVYTGCAMGNPDVRVFCTDGGVPPFARAVGAENCALWGQTCAPTSGGTACAGEPTGRACTGQPTRECDGTSLHWCVEGDDGGVSVDRGIACASNGAMDCGGYPSKDSPLWIACKPESDGAACEPDASAACNDGGAIMCPSGVTEALDCAALLGSPGACTAGALAPPFDWTSPCSLTPSACAGDSCDGDRLTSCERGATFSMSCASEGLGVCRLITADLESTPRAACGPPLP
jgi:hypothetical protein